MTSGKAHYSGLVLPFLVAGAAAGLGRFRRRPRTMRLACAGLLLSCAGGYALEGAGPFGGNYAPAMLTDHSRRAAALAQSLPRDAAVSASSALVPHLSNRPLVYVFPAVLDAEYVFLDLRSSPAPTSAGDVFLRVAALLQAGGWRVEEARDGLLMLQRADNAEPTDTNTLLGILGTAHELVPPPAETTPDTHGQVSLISAELRASPNAAIDVDGPRGDLHTIWRANQPLPSGTHLEFWLDLSTGEQVHSWDLASLCWNPPDHWAPGQPVHVDVPDVPMRRFRSWRAVWSSP
jgi:hypothetical protein